MTHKQPRVLYFNYFELYLWISVLHNNHTEQLNQDYCNSLMRYLFFNLVWRAQILNQLSWLDKK